LPVHGATSSGWLSPRGRVLARAGIGILTFVVAPDLVDEAVGDGLAWEVRLRALPARLGVYFVLGLCLFSWMPYGQVLRELMSGLEDALAAAGWQVPASAALTGVRRRVGEKPLESLFWRLCSAVSPGRAPWSHICGLLAVAWDGTTVTVPASGENAAAFGRPGKSGGGDCHYPQVRLVSLIACGTRALLGAAMGPVTGKGTGERALAAGLLPRLRGGMLLVADRNFYSWQLWHAAAGTGAALLWRVKTGMLLTPSRVLPDGSYLAVIADPARTRRRTVRNGARRRRRSALPPDTAPVPGVTVRVIEFWVRARDDQGRTRTELYRVITTLLDWRAYPAAELAAGYGWRWAIETGYREFKTCLRGPGRVLRPQTPELARQEIWGYLVIYQAIRVIIAWAAAGAGLDPDRISFTAALHAARRTMATARTGMDAALAAAGAEITATLVPERPGRVWVRAVTRPRSSYKSRNTAEGPISQQATYTITITPPAPAAAVTTDQRQQPKPQPDDPP
jgi:hypothetical protein